MFTVLLTRPAHQIANLSKAIEDLGWRCFSVPTIEIIFADAQLIQQQCKNLACDAMIFTSANAVYPILPLWQQMPNAQVFAIGSGTARVLAQNQIQARVPEQEQFTSEGLLNLKFFQAVENRKIIIFTGKNPKQLLAKELKARGAQVTVLEVYERKCPNKDLSDFSRGNSPAVIVCSSKESLLNLLAMAKTAVSKHWLLQQKILTISKEMQLLAEKMGFQESLVAKNAGESSIMEALKTFAQSSPAPNTPAK